MFKPNLIIWEPNVNDDIWDEYNFEETYGLDMRLFDRTEECTMPVLVDDSLDYRIPKTHWIQSCYDRGSEAPSQACRRSV